MAGLDPAVLKDALVFQRQDVQIGKYASVHAEQPVLGVVNTKSASATSPIVHSSLGTFTQFRMRAWLGP
jgi:hypothetical protein